MSDQPIPKLDPDALKKERHDVYLGSDVETGHDHIGQEPNVVHDGGSPITQPTGGATPPAR